MKRILTLLTIMTIAAGNLVAQTPNMYKYHTGTLYTATPFLATGYQGYHNQFIIRASDMVGKQAGSITKLYLRAGSTGTTTYSNIEIRLGMTTQNDFGGNYTGTTTTFIAPMTLVFSGSLTVTHTTGQWCEIVLQTPFGGYNGTSNMVIDTYIPSTNAPSGTGLSLQGGYYTLNGNACTEMYYYGNQTNTTGNQYVYYKDGGFLVSAGVASQPTALFYAPPSPCQASPTTFINNSIMSGFNIAYQWTITPNTFTYANGTTASSKNVTVRFNNVGTYTVKMRASNNIGSDSITKSVTVGAPTVAPTADFVATKRIVAKATQIQPFTDLSSNCPQSWAWSSPDYQTNTPVGNPFIVPTAQHGQAFFAYSGSWKICLDATNTIGTSSICKADYVKVVDAATLCTDTLSSQTEGYVYDEGSYGNSYGNNRSLSNCKGFLIDPCASSVSLTFEQIKLATGGDSIFIHDGFDQNAPKLGAIGSNKNGTNPTYTAASGKMFVYMITNGSGVDSGFTARWSSTSGTYGKPTAGFEIPSVPGFVKDTVYSGYTVTYQNTSTGVDMKYIWDVNGDAVVDSTKANSSFTFSNYTSNPQQYTIMLIAYNCKGEDTATKVITIMPVTTKPLNVNFVADKTVASPSDTVTLTDLTIGATAWNWVFIPSSVTFLSGYSKNSQHPKIKVTGTGCLTVRLVASNAIGVDSATKNCYINQLNYCPPGTASALNPDLGFNNVTINNINNNTPTGVSDYTMYGDSSFGKTTVYRGKSYTLSVSRLTNDLNMSRKAWIDYNLNASFDDAGELVGSDLNNKNLSATYTFTVPLDARIGTSRLRLGAGYGNTLLEPCAAQMGEYEDYEVKIGNDDVAPVITLLGSDTIYVELNSSFTDPGATAFDNLEGNITSKIVVTNNVDVTQVGFYSISYNVTDLYGNKAITKIRTIVVKVDLTPPVITMNGSTPVYVHVYSPYSDAGATAFDNYSGNLTSLISTISTVDTSILGTYTVTYSVHDYFGFTAVKTRQVIVNDTMRPVITAVNGTSTYVHGVGVPLTDNLVVKVTDNYYKNLVATRTGTVDVNTLGVYNICYNVTDGSGNVANQVCIAVEVKDTTQPTIAFNGSDTLVLDVFTSYTEPVPAVTDNYYSGTGISVVTTTSTPAFNRNILGTYTYTYTATDGSNNVNTRTRTIMVVDREKPVINVLGTTPMMHCLGHPWADPGLQLIDNYYSQAQLLPLVQSISTVDPYHTGIYTVTYSLTDPSNNVADVIERTVVVQVCDGTGDQPLSTQINMYPNPTSGVVNVVFNRDKKTDVTIKVTDILGNQVTEVKEVVKSGTVKIDLNGKCSGVYFVRVFAGNEVLTQKINLIK